MKQLVFLILLLLLTACEEKQETERYEKIAVDYLEKRGYSDLIRQNDRIPEVQFLSQRQVFDSIGQTTSNSIIHSEFFECAQNQLCYNTFIEGDRVKSLYYSGTLKKGTKGKRFSIGIFIDTVFLNPIGIIHGHPRYALSMSKYDNSIHSAKKELTNEERIAFNDSLFKVDSLEIVGIKQNIEKSIRKQNESIHSDSNFLNFFFRDYRYHIALLSVVQDHYFPTQVIQKESAFFERENNEIHLFLHDKIICIKTHEIKKCN